VSWRTSKGNSAMATRFLWRVFAPVEFIVTVVGGVPLYLCRVVFIYLNALRGLFENAATVFVLRFRVGRISSSLDQRASAPPLSEASARGPVGRGRLSSWLN